MIQISPTRSQHIGLLLDRQALPCWLEFISADREVTRRAGNTSKADQKEGG